MVNQLKTIKEFNEKNALCLDMCKLLSMRNILSEIYFQGKINSEFAAL